MFRYAFSWKSYMSLFEESDYNYLIHNDFFSTRFLSLLLFFVLFKSISITVFPKIFTAIVSYDDHCITFVLQRIFSMKNHYGDLNLRDCFLFILYFFLFFRDPFNRDCVLILYLCHLARKLQAWFCPPASISCSVYACLS